MEKLIVMIAMEDLQALYKESQRVPGLAREVDDCRDIIKRGKEENKWLADRINDLNTEANDANREIDGLSKIIQGLESKSDEYVDKYGKELVRTKELEANAVSAMSGLNATIHRLEGELDRAVEEAKDIISEKDKRIRELELALRAAGGKDWVPCDLVPNEDTPIGTPVMVRDNRKGVFQLRYFAGFGKDGSPKACPVAGGTTTYWNYMRLATEEEIAARTPKMVKSAQEEAEDDVDRVQ